MHASEVDDNSKVLRYLQESGCEIRQLGTVLGGFQTICAVAGGTKLPAILITAGAHADEVAGVRAALRLVSELQTEHRLYVIPVRDPFGFEGYRANLQFALGCETAIAKVSDVYGILRSHDVLFEDKTYILSQVGKYAFAYDVGIDFPTSSVARRVDSLVRADPYLLKRLAAVNRVVAPWNLPMPRHGDCYKQGARGMIVTPSGFVGNFNRFFDVEDAPPEVKYTRGVVNEVMPSLVLDLHEGYGQGFYVYKPESAGALTECIVSALVSAVEDRGGHTLTPAELQPYWGPSLGSDRTFFGSGVFLSGSTTKSDFARYCLGKSAIALTFETGGLGPVEWRTDLQVWAACAAVRQWENTIDTEKRHDGKFV